MAGRGAVLRGILHGRGNRRRRAQQREGVLFEHDSLSKGAASYRDVRNAVDGVLKRLFVGARECIDLLLQGEPLKTMLEKPVIPQSRRGAGDESLE
jgi:hypothetical protein